MALLEVNLVSKSYAGTAVLQDVSFRVDEGEIICLLGPSGCGKTTLLRIVAGLEIASAGQVTFDGQPLDGVEVHRRGFGLMFQDYALFPHKDVVANVAFGLRMQSLPRQEVEARVAEMLDLVGLTGYERRKVYDLSGGEQQRVALARSLAPGPRLLMLDEPLGSLDRALREGLMNDLRAILKQVGVTSIYVTHDQEEAFAVADRVLIMDRGHIVQQGTPQSVYWSPASPRVARFLGLSNLVPGRVVALESGQGPSSSLMVETPLGQFTLPKSRGVRAGQLVTVLIRPEAARLVEECPEEGELVVKGRVGACSFRGSYYRLVMVDETGLELTFELVSEASRLPGIGKPVRLGLRLDAVTLLAEESDEQTVAD